MKTRVLILALALSLLVTGLVLANGNVERTRAVLGGGASDSTGGGGVALRATLGQPVVGGVSGGDVTLGQGFWRGGAAAGGGYEIYLPLVLRDH